MRLSPACGETLPSQFFSSLHFCFVTSAGLLWASMPVQSIVERSERSSRRSRKNARCCLRWRSCRRADEEEVRRWRSALRWGERFIEELGEEDEVVRDVREAEER